MPRCNPLLHSPSQAIHLPITLSHPLQLILFLDSITITAPLSCIDQLLRQALRHTLNVPEGRFSRPDCQQGDRLVHTSERGDIDGLTTHGPGATDTCGVFTGTAVDDGVDGDLDGVLVGHYVYLELLIEVVGGGLDRGRYNFEGVSDNTDGHEFLAVIASVHHERVCETFDDGTLGFAETLDGIAAGGVGDIDWRADLDVVAVAGENQHLRNTFVTRMNRYRMRLLAIEDYSRTQQEYNWRDLLTSRKCRGFQHLRMTTC